MFPRSVTCRLGPNGDPIWRKDSSKLFGCVEAKGDSDLFKSPPKPLGLEGSGESKTSKPTSKRWEGIFSEEASRRQPSSIKAAARAAAEPGMISLGAGAPSAAYFPFKEVDVKVSNELGSSADMETPDSIIHMAKYDFEAGTNDYGLDVALNYGQGTGSAQMIRFVTEHTELLHDPPYADWGCCLTVGSTAAWDSTLRIFCNKGDHILVENYAFASALETAWPLGIKTLGVKMDEQGLIPTHLDELLCSWDVQARGARKPFLLYMVPTGQNPTGATQSLARRKAIYSVAQKHNLYIVEDEPYYYLQLPEYRPNQVLNSSHMDGLIPSYLSLDVDGRVLRMDSLSKVLSPGTRLGWVTASQQVIEKFVRQNETSSQHPSGISQVIVFKLLNHHWGHSGFFKWLESIQKEYTWRRNVFAEACDQYLPKDFVDWTPTHAGMFQWIEIKWKSHPLYKTGSDHPTIQKAIFNSAVKHKVFVTPGSCFWAESDAVEDRMFFRATYASASKEDLTEAARRLASAIKAEFE
ncbi:uncharacterized protein N7484_009400 [Penicillium longicatenatum]|uniref:uncharacterized protein n=1 Tax=Penicillium longicatenatum TaxID=1561947 RepID=UPI0025481EF6|nr:uncharacterized protein N7484_009400 [Penicillium longicatenatum]KAJ5636087.1 hypothetical protein N7484_009400 [Penicillium longicatenatum]